MSGEKLGSLVTEIQAAIDIAPRIIYEMPPGLITPAELASLFGIEEGEIAEPESTFSFCASHPLQIPSRLPRLPEFELSEIVFNLLCSHLDDNFEEGELRDWFLVIRPKTSVYFWADECPICSRKVREILIESGLEEIPEPTGEDEDAGEVVRLEDPTLESPPAETLVQLKESKDTKDDPDSLPA